MIVACTDQADGAAKKSTVDQQIPEDNGPIGRREKVDDVLGTGNAIRQATQDERQ